MSNPETGLRIGAEYSDGEHATIDPKICKRIRGKIDKTSRLKCI